MPSKCIADKKIGADKVGFRVFTGNCAGIYEKDIVYPNDFLCRKWKYDFEYVKEMPAPASEKKSKKPKDSENDSAAAEGKGGNS